MRTNAKNSRTKKARNFGGEAALVRAMDCIVHTAADASGMTADELAALDWTACGGAACAHHVHPRKRGGHGEGRMGLFNACARHGDEAGEASPTKGPSSKRRAFENLYSLDVVAITDAIALAHPPPLGIRGLAARFVAWHGIELTQSTPSIEQALGCSRLVGYDLAALMGWTRRRMAAVSLAAVCAPDLARDNLVTDMLYTLGGEFEESSHGEDGPTWALCREAGWPS